MIDPDDGRPTRPIFVTRILNAWKRHQRAHLEAFGKLGRADTWLRSLGVMVAFLLVTYLLFS